MTQDSLIDRIKALAESNHDASYRLGLGHAAEIVRLHELQRGEISDVVTVRAIIDDMPHVAGKGVKFKLRYLEYENDELKCSTGPIDLVDVLATSKPVDCALVGEAESLKEMLLWYILDSLVSGRSIMRQQGFPVGPEPTRDDAISAYLRSHTGRDFEAALLAAKSRAHKIDGGKDYRIQSSGGRMKPETIVRKFFAGQLKYKDGTPIDMDSIANMGTSDLRLYLIDSLKRYGKKKSTKSKAQK